MTTGKKKRMSMLDSLAAAGGPTATLGGGSMMATNRALRAARDAVDSHHVWELDPEVIANLRLEDRLAPEDVADLRESIEVNGQTVPILVRRDPNKTDHYLLVYGRRRLEAIRHSDKVQKVRALVASMDDDSAVRAQISENMARRDLSFIEKALFARELIDSGFGNQNQVAEVLTVTKSAISMALAIVDAVGTDLVRAIGPAHGIGRPRWEELGKALDAPGADPDRLIALADAVHTKASIAATEGRPEAPQDTSLAAFEAVMKAATEALPRPTPTRSDAPARPRPRPLTLGGKKGGSVKRTSKGLQIDLAEGGFADWVEAEAEALMAELHDRWQRQTDTE